MPRLTRAVPIWLVGGLLLEISDTVKSLLIAVFCDGACCGAYRWQRAFVTQFRCALDGVQPISTRPDEARLIVPNTLRV
jgi:hypothetical protein